MIELKRSIMIKCKPIDETELDVLFNNYGRYVNYILNEIKNIYEEYSDIKEDKQEECSNCKEIKLLNKIHNEERNKICLNCFNRLWSEFTLFKQLKPQLEKSRSLPFLSIHQGYIYGTISTSVKIFKSYISKKLTRDFEIKRAENNCFELQGKIDNLKYHINKTKERIKESKATTEELTKQEKELFQLERELKRENKLARRKRITFPNFNSKEIYFGKLGALGPAFQSVGTHCAELTKELTVLQQQGAGSLIQK